MQYNIFGGFYTSNEPYTYEPKREKAALEVIKQEDPDILTICEARFNSPNKFGILRDYKKIFGYPYCYLTSYKERSGMGIFSKFPFNVKDYAYGLNPLLRVEFKIDKKLIMLDLVHPHPTLGEDARNKFITHVLSGLKKPYILMGDFNAISPEDKYDRKKLLEGFSRFDSNYKEVVEDFLKRKSIRRVLDSGLKDTLNSQKWKFTVPTDMLNKNKDSGLRLDFIFCSNDFKIIDSGIIVNEFTNVASDHYPVFAILEI